MLDAELLHGLAHAIDGGRCIRQRLFRENDQKLFPAVAIKAIALPEVGLNCSRKQAKRAVTREVTETVVVRFERVHIAERSTMAVAMAQDALIEGRKILLETQAVGDGGERIGARRLVITGGIEAKRAVSGLKVALHPRHPPGRLDSGLELLDFKGFRDVLVRPGSQAFDEVSVATTRGKNEVRVPGKRRFLFAYFSTELEAVHDRHLPVRNDQVCALRSMHRPGVAAIAGRPAGMPAAADHIKENVSGVRIVLDYDYS